MSTAIKDDKRVPLITPTQAAALVKELTPPPPDAKPGFTAGRLEKFIILCQTGASVGSALVEAGLVGPANSGSAGYLSGVEEEIAIEELFYQRAASSDNRVLTDEAWQELPPTAKLAHNQAGVVSASQLYKLVDWLYFVRSLPLKAIASALHVKVPDVAVIKAAISNDFAKTIKAQHADGFIADLLRTKELIRADIAARRSKLPPGDRMHAIYARLIWDIENKFIDRLQETGLIDKSLGRIDIHEEWEVTIGTAGQPINTKLRSLESSTDEILDLVASPVAEPPQLQEAMLNADDQGPVRGAPGAEDKAPEMSAFIKVGD